MSARGPSTRGSHAGPAALLAVLLGVAVLVWWLVPDSPWDRVAELVEAARSRPGLAVLGLLALQIVASLFLAPVWPGMAAAGYLFAWPLGTCVAVVTTLAGSVSAFVVGRYAARERVQDLVGRHARLASLNDAVAVNGFRVAFLSRASLIVPANLLNYALAVSGIAARTFVGATFLGLLPVAALYAFAGAALARAGLAFSAAGIRLPPEALFVLALMLLAILYVWWRLRRGRSRDSGNQTPG